MATAALSNRFQPIYNHTSTRTKEIQAVNKEPLETTIAKVLKLRQLQKTTGFHTTRSMSQLMGHLTPDELVIVAERLLAAE